MNKTALLAAKPHKKTFIHLIFIKMASKTAGRERGRERKERNERKRETVREREKQK
jgi:hypothetical protein